MLSLKFNTSGFEISLEKLNDEEAINIENDSSKQQSKCLLIYTLEGRYKFKNFFELSKNRYYVPSQTGEFKGFSNMKNLGGIANNPSLFNIISCFDIFDDKYTPDNTISTELQHLYWIVKKELIEKQVLHPLSNHYSPFSEEGKNLLIKITKIQSNLVDFITRLGIEAFSSDYHDHIKFDDKELLPVVENSYSDEYKKDSESFNFDDIDSVPFTIGKFPQLHTYVKLKDGTIGILWSDNTEDSTIHVIVERDWETPRGGYDPEYISCYQFNRSDIAIENDDLSEVKKTCEFDINPIKVKSLNGRYHKETKENAINTLYVKRAIKVD